jgi:hypothetical protein
MKIFSLHSALFILQRRDRRIIELEPNPSTVAYMMVLKLPANANVMTRELSELKIKWMVKWILWTPIKILKNLIAKRCCAIWNQKC